MSKRHTVIFQWLSVTMIACLVSGCRPKEDPHQVMQPQEYADASKAVMVEGKAKSDVITSRPLPNVAPGAPIEAKRNARAKLAQSADDLAKIYTETEQKLGALRPPPQYLEMHESARSFFHVAAEGNRNWANAMRSGNRQEANKATLELNEMEIQAAQ